MLEPCLPYGSLESTLYAETCLSLRPSDPDPGVDAVTGERARVMREKR
jgi:hypothetical protein